MPLKRNTSSLTIPYLSPYFDGLFFFLIKILPGLLRTVKAHTKRSLESSVKKAFGFFNLKYSISNELRARAEARLIIASASPPRNHNHKIV
jgi:hypothetical protein